MNEQTPVPPLNAPQSGASGERPQGILAQMPSTKQQSWGALISIVIIVLMIIVGAFYAWGERIAQNQQYPTAATSTSL